MARASVIAIGIQDATCPVFAMLYFLKADSVYVGFRFPLTLRNVTAGDANNKGCIVADKLQD